MNTRAYSKTDNVFRRMMNFTLEMAKKKKKIGSIFCLSVNTSELVFSRSTNSIFITKLYLAR